MSKKVIVAGPYFFYGAIRSEIGRIRDYVETIAWALKQESQTFDAHVAKRAAKLPEHAVAGLYEDAYETASNLADRFPAFAWQTTFVAIYSFLEDEMLGLARLVSRLLDITPAPKKQKYKGIFLAQQHLQFDCAIAFPDGSPHWLQAQDYNRIRNAIVHRRGRIGGWKYEEAIRQYTHGKDSVSIDDFYRLQLSEAFCLEVLDNVEALLEDLFRLADERVS
ncbi:MAG TPA: hypothetical protein VMS17_18075 [Gemmataceae bacterium]|nr:hypothetical protein [Gemmataceae bacterium]